ncbi:hypothetical protein EVAR_28572_1 [Eumeta japonica]|uniref:Uncharacterized protein n=1 Tax=Eumeta variegata TaxID=151549 RepID=A0A4C1UWR8_EUMVA|nr:hypothetical protein EVAR_28572_1 [Eumeta japonica]
MPLAVAIGSCHWQLPLAHANRPVACPKHMLSIRPCLPLKASSIFQNNLRLFVDTFKFASCFLSGRISIAQLLRLIGSSLEPFVSARPRAKSLTTDDGHGVTKSVTGSLRHTPRKFISRCHDRSIEPVVRRRHV